MSKGIEKLEEDYKDIKQTNLLCSIAGSAGPIRINKKPDYLHWKACFNGPKNTPYMYGLFIMEIKFDENYPETGPEVRMRTPTYHPNIDCSNGHICVDYLSHWKKGNNIIGIINTVHDLLADPNPKSAYCSIDDDKAKYFRSKYAVESQSYDWSNCWNNGWNNNEKD